MNKHSYSLFLFLFLFIASAWAQDFQLPSHQLNANGSVYAMELDTVNKQLYIGGDFTSLHYGQKNGEQVDLNSEVLDFFPSPNAAVYAVLEDGLGGWFLGGDFTKIGDSVRNRFAHIDSTGKLYPKRLSLNGRVSCFERVGDRLFMAGVFNSINGLSRTRIACFDLLTQSLDSFAPVIDLKINSMSHSGNTLYIAGLFGFVNGQLAQRLASFDLATGNLNNWSSVPDADVHVIRAMPGTGRIFIGGSFANVNNQSRKFVAELDSATGNVNPWSATANGYVNDIVLSGDTLLLAGDFTMLSGVSRNHLAAYSLTNGALLPMNPNINGDVNDLEKVGNHLYLGGDFSQIDQEHRGRVAKMNLTSGNLESWSSSSNGSVKVVHVQEDKIYIGGLYNIIGEVERNRLAAIDLNTGSLSAWNPDCDKKVRAMHLSGNTLYVGGEFLKIGGLNRFFLAAIDKQTGIPSAWDPRVSDHVYSLASHNQNVYVGGKFIYTGSPGTSNPYLVAIDSTTAQLTQTNFGLDDAVYDIKIINNTLFLAGKFDQVKGQARKRVAAIDLPSYNLSSWNPNVTGNLVRCMVQKGNSLLLGGDFTSVSGQSRQNIASVQLNSAALDNLSLGFPANSSIYSMAILGDDVLFGGNFNTLPALNRSFIASVQFRSSNLNSLNLMLSGSSVNALLYHQDLFVGGNFSKVLGADQSNLAQLKCNQIRIDDPVLSCSDYTWLDGVTYSQSNGVATFIIPSTNACDTLLQLNLTIPSFSTGLSQNLDSLWSDELDAHYQWINCTSNQLIPNDTNRYFVPQFNGQFAVILRKANCRDTSACFTVNSVGLTMQPAEESISLYPNPSVNHINLKGLKANESYEFQVFNATGQLVFKSKSIGSKEVKFDLDLEAGSYFLKVYSRKIPPQLFPFQLQ